MWITTRASLALLLAGGIAACATQRRHEPAPEKALLCDGETEVTIEGEPRTRADGQAIASAMMAAWELKNPGQPWAMPQEGWEAQVRMQHFIADSFDNSYLLADGQSAGHPVKDFTERDLLVWKRDTERLVVDGARIFHSADELGSTIAVSCDMCHPDAANTHPETYPKYQVQIGKAVLLRDMINWCLEHPVRAERMSEADPRMKALEAYVYAQRTGRPLAYGKH